MHKTMWTAAAVTLLKKFWLTAALVALVAGGPAPAHAVAAGAGIVWGACPEAPSGVTRDPRQTCGTLRVPLDYAHPDGRQITIAVSRIPASDPAKRRGILLLNPGGPGLSGLDQPSDEWMTNEGAEYDRIGFDPRGVGHSTPITCGLTESDYLPPWQYPAADGSITANVAFAKSVARRCQAASGDLLPYITTANTARDMDRIRAALGEPKISYWGASGGSYIGAVYASLFAGRVDRMVLDSVVDPEKVWYGQLRSSAVGVAARFPDAAAYAAGENVLGDTPAAVTKAYLALAARLDRTPAALPGQAVSLTGGLLRFLTNSLLQQDAGMPYLIQLWTDAAALVNGGGNTDFIDALLPQASPSGQVYPGVPADNMISVVYAITCGDAAWSHDVNTYARNVAADRKAYPLTDGAGANVWACAYWPSRPVEPTIKISSHGTRNILLLQNERDPNTPVEGARSMRKALGDRAVLVTTSAGGHGVYFNHVTCGTTAGDAFLNTGALPARDTIC